jgi:hypothetical protein
MFQMYMCVLALKYVPDVYVCIGFEICTRCLCVYWLWNMHEMSMCVLVLKYIWDVYVWIGFEICTRCLNVYWYTHRHLVHISKPIHTYTSGTYFKANTHIDISYIFQSQYTHRHLVHISKTISFEIYMRCLCVNWLWNMYEMSKCVLALKYVWDVYVCIGSEICTRCLIHM